MVPSIRVNCLRLLTAAMMFMVVSTARAQNHPPRFMDVTSFTKVATGQVYTFSVKYLDEDGDPAKSIACVIEGPGGVQRKEFTGFGSNPDWKNGVEASFEMGPFSAGTYSLHYETESLGATSHTDPWQFVAEPPIFIWIRLAVGLIVSLLFMPLIFFLLCRSIAPNADPTRAARFGLLAGIVLAYVWFAYLFGGLENPVLLGIGGVVALGAVVAILSGKKPTTQEFD